MGAALTARGLDPVKGIGRRGYSDALVIPLHPELHCVGPRAIDGGIGREEWERRYGEQEKFIDRVGEQLGVDLWRLASLWASKPRKPKTRSKKLFGRTLPRS